MLHVRRPVGRRPESTLSTRSRQQFVGAGEPQEAVVLQTQGIREGHSRLVADNVHTPIVVIAISAIIDHNGKMENHGSLMSSVAIRNIDPEVKEQLRQRAAPHGRSMGAELRAIVSAAVQDDAAPTLNLGEAIRRRLAALGGVDLESHAPVTPRAPPTFEP